MSGATNKITALYCRLSQEDARLGESLSIENQKAILLEYAKKNHFPNPVFFVDDGYSGTNYDRPGFQSMLVEIEAGRVGIVITKDLSRLGRNSALTGLYTNFTFPQYGVRYIAINDNYDTIDPNSVNNDFAGIKNWFNEFYARDTSRKIRAVQKAKGERGVPLTVNVPYGYVKDPENLKHWLVDPEAAAIVKRIFSMCMEGRGPTQIANQLWVDKVLTPTAYKLSHGLSTNSPAPEDPYRWDKRAVSSILERLEYTGCTVNFKTYTNSIWDKKRHLNPVENQAIFPDTHERIIDDDVFEKVREIRSQRHRMTRTGKSSIFSGMVYCADCGSKMQYGSSNHRDFSQDFFDCSLHKKNGSKCKGHFIRVKVLEGRVLSHVQRVTDYILCHEDYFRKVMEEQLRVESTEKLTVLKKQLARNEKRIADLKRLFMKIYEDNVNGKLSDDRFDMMSQSYDIAAGVEHGAGDHEQQLGVDEPRLLQLGGHRPHGVAAFHLDGGGQGGLIQGAHIVDGQPADTGQQERGHDDPRQIAQPPQAALFLWLRPLAGARLLTDLLGIPFGRIGVLIIGHMIGSFLYFFRRAHPDKIRRSHLRHRIAHTRNK